MVSMMGKMAVSCAVLGGMFTLSSGAMATVASSPLNVQLAGTPSESINNAWAIAGQHVGNNFVGVAQYLGNVTADKAGSVTLTLPNAIGSSGYAAIIGVGNNGSDVVLGLNSSAATSAIINNTSLDTYTNDISSYLPQTFNLDGYTIGVSVTLPNTNIKSDVISILNGTFSVPVTVNGIPVGNYDIMPYSITLPGTSSPTTLISPGTSIDLSTAWSADIASYGIAFGSGSLGHGTLVDFDAPTNVGAFTATVITPEPASLSLLAVGAAGLLALRRRRTA